MKVTVSGATGSGKSTISKLLAKELGYSYYSVGQLMRTLAKNKGMTIMELTKKAEEDPSIDKELDRMQIEIGTKEDNFVMDSRLGFHFIPASYSIYLDVDVKEAARRIMGDKRSEETYNSMDDAVRSLKRRMQSESMRYKEYYGIDFPNKKNFKLWIDTTSKNPEQVVAEIVAHIKK